MSRVCHMAAIIVVISTFSASAQERRGGSFWKSSVVALIGSTAVDAHSSWGRRELNPLLRSADGRFAGRALAIKAAIAGGAVAAQYFLLRQHPKAEKYAAIANFGMASVFGAVAAYNYTNQRSRAVALPAPQPAATAPPAYLLASEVSSAR